MQWTSHKFFATLRSVAKTPSEPWNEAFGQLFSGEALSARGLSQNQAAKRAGLTGNGWGRIANGRETKRGHILPVDGRPATVARMAQAIGVTVEQLREVEHPLAARALERLIEVNGEQWSSDQSGPRERLLRIRREVDALLDQLDGEQG